MKTNIYNRIASFKTNLIIVAILGMLFPTGLYSQNLTILSPNGGENWLQGANYTITWQNTGEPGDLMIEYTEDGGNYWNYLGFVYAQDTSSSFIFQNYFYATTQAKIRIYYYNDPSNSDESDGFFTVTEPPVYFSSPYYGSYYYRTQPVYISWYSNTLQTFTIDYSLDNGSSWNNIVSNYSGFDYIWTAPDQLSSAAVIRISDPADPGSFALSPVFSIVDIPQVTLTAPNGGETWNYGGVADVTWSGSNLPYYLYIDFSADGGQNWTNLGYGYSDPTGGTAQVYVPYAGTENALVRIYDPAYPDASDQSDNVFTVYVPPVIVYSPYEGQAMYNKSDVYTSWITDGISLLNIELSSDNGQSWTTVAQDVDASLGYYYFTLNGTPSQTCLLKLSDASDPATYGLSPVFTILETPVITLTSPVGGEVWNTGANYNITWSYDNPNAYYALLEYSTDNGQTWNYIYYVYYEGATGSYLWTTPEVNSDQCLFRISDYSLPFVSDTSGTFSILTFPESPICMVTVDSTTNHNVIVWEKPSSDLIDQFIVYKESNEAGVYEALGTVDYNSPSVITDTNSNPAMKSYRYKLGFSDAQGHIFPMSNFHQTIHLTINQGVGNSWNLIWTDYLGFAVPSYNIYRKSGNGSFEQIATISASFTSYTDQQAPSGDVYYVIEVLNPSGCNTGNRATEYGSSYSNVATNSSLGVNDPLNALSVSVYPNPADRQINILAGEDLSGELTITLSDLLGKEVFRAVSSDMRPGMKYTINAEELRNGLYIIRVASEKGSFTGKVVVKH